MLSWRFTFNTRATSNKVNQRGITKRTNIGDTKEYKIYSIQKGRKKKEEMDKQKTNSKIVDVNSTILIYSLNMCSLTISIKRQWLSY